MKPYSLMTDDEFLAEAHRIADACAERLPGTAYMLRAIAKDPVTRMGAITVLHLLEFSVFVDLGIQVAQTVEQRLDEIRGAA